MAMTKRMLQLGEEIREFIATMLVRGDISDPRLKGITIHSVKMSPDLQVAKIYYTVSTLLNSSHQDVAVALKRARGFIRHEIGKKLLIRYSPELIFYYDPSLDYAEKINALLTNIKKESDENNGDHES
jgi:ribosome-binding factor A